MNDKNTIYGPDREGNEKKRDKIMKACTPKEKRYVKVFANGVFEMSIPIRKEDIPPDEQKFIE